MNKDFQGPLYCLKKPVHSPVEKNAGWAIYGEGKVLRQKQRLHGPGCSDATLHPIPAILGNSLSYPINPAQTHSLLLKFLKLFTQTKNSQYQVNLIVCNQPYTYIGAQVMLTLAPDISQ